VVRKFREWRWGWHVCHDCAFVGDVMVGEGSYLSPLEENAVTLETRAVAGLRNVWAVRYTVFYHA